jgi:hypothetical protein
MAINEFENSTVAPLGTFRTGVANVKIPVLIEKIENIFFYVIIQRN